MEILHLKIKISEKKISLGRFNSQIAEGEKVNLKVEQKKSSKMKNKEKWFLKNEQSLRDPQHDIKQSNIPINRTPSWEKKENEAGKKVE